MPPTAQFKTTGTAELSDGVCDFVSVHLRVFCDYNVTDREMQGVNSMGCLYHAHSLIFPLIHD